MGNLGMPELLLILLLALLLFGPKKLPEVGKQVGKALGEFRRASNDLKRTIQEEIDRAEHEQPAPETKTAVAAKGEEAPAGTVATTPAAEPANKPT